MKVKKALRLWFEESSRLATEMMKYSSVHIWIKNIPSELQLYPGISKYTFNDSSGTFHLNVIDHEITQIQIGFWVYVDFYDVAVATVHDTEIPIIANSIASSWCPVKNDVDLKEWINFLDK